MPKPVSLADISAEIEGFGGGLPPVHSWQPSRDAEMDLEIMRDGRWIHEGGEITRVALVKLLASVLRRETDGRYALVTPAERVFIRVQDVPFLIVDWSLQHSDTGQQVLALETSLGEQLIMDTDNPLWLEPDVPQPYIMVRPGLAGVLSRAAYYRLTDVLEQRAERWGIESRGYFCAF